MTQAPGKVAKTASHPFGRDTGSDHGLRGRPTIHPDGCSSSRFRSRSMPSRMKDLYRWPHAFDGESTPITHGRSSLSFLSFCSSLTTVPSCGDETHLLRLASPWFQKSGEEAF